MKLELKSKAIILRKKGFSITTISEKLGVAKSSVSLWVRDVRLNPKTLSGIKQRSHSTVAIEKRRNSRLENENVKKRYTIDLASKEISKLTRNELFLVGIALYWGEGTKKKRGVAEFTNSDPIMIKVMKRFFLEICKVPKEKFRGHVYVHSHLPPSTAVMYWSKISAIPTKQFHKTSIQKNVNRVQKDTLPYGTFAMSIYDTQLKLKIDGWIKGLGEEAGKMRQ
jgi:predicted transcriptional regulator